MSGEQTADRPDVAHRVSPWVRFDGMTWPNPADPTGVQWRLRYGPQPPSREDVLAAASFMHAYAHLIDLPQRERNQRVSQIRVATLRADGGGS
jgi:hypothetical protein